MKERRNSSSFRIDPDLEKPLEVATAQAGASKTVIINRALREALLGESKLRNIIGSLSRIRGHQANTERLINLHIKIQEEFIKYFLRVTPVQLADQHDERESRMEARYRGFIDRLLKEDLAEGGQAQIIRAVMDAVREPDEPIV